VFENDHEQILKTSPSSSDNRILDDEMKSSGVAFALPLNSLSLFSSLVRLELHHHCHQSATGTEILVKPRHVGESLVPCQGLLVSPRPLILYSMAITHPLGRPRMQKHINAQAGVGRTLALSRMQSVNNLNLC
jgi:hypothetical protein